MFKNKVLFAVIGVIVILSVSGAAVFLKTKQNATEPEYSVVLETSPSVNENQITASTNENFSGTIFDLIKKGVPLKCSYSLNDQQTNTATTGTTYVSGNKVRADFEMTDNAGKKTQGHTIADGTYFYIWSSVLPNGFKLKADAFDVQEETQNMNEAVKELQNKYDYQCLPWVPSDTAFELPKDVQFSDLSETLKNVNENKSSMCGACDLIKDEAGKAACRKNLGC